jgi:hypothetical protein
MSDSDEYAWRAALLMHAYNEAMTNIPGAPLDLQTWLRTHFQRWPVAFAYHNWSNYQPAIRKIRLLKIQA